MELFHQIAISGRFQKWSSSFSTDPLSGEVVTPGLDSIDKVLIQFITAEYDEICTAEQARQIVSQIPAVATTIMQVDGADHKTLMRTSTPEFVQGMVDQLEYSPCAPPKTVTPPSVSNQSYTITDRNAPDYTVQSFTVEPDFCAARTEVEVSPLASGKSAVTVSDDKKTFSFFYDDDLEPLGQTQTVTISSIVKSDKPGTPDTVTKTSFDLSFKNPCEDAAFITMTPTPQTDPRSDDYSGDAFSFTYNPFIVEPAFCDVQVSCRSVQGPSDALSCQELYDGETLTWLFTPENVVNDNVVPGDYVYTYDVTVGPVTESFEVTVTLIDPCNNPSITEPITAPMEYTITDYE